MKINLLLFFINFSVLEWNFRAFKKTLWLFKD